MGRHDLALGVSGRETAVSVDGMTWSVRLHPGDWVSLHWQWVCDRLTVTQLVALRHYSAYHLGLVNQRLGGRAGTSGPRIQ